jgi:hypothetical protein
MYSKGPIDMIFHSQQRKILVCSNEIDFTKKGRVDVFFLMVQESRGSAGGRGGGSGSRHIQRILAFSCNDGVCECIFDTSEKQEVDRFEIPYSAVALDVKLGNGIDMVVQGVVDPLLVDAYKQIISKLK